MKKATTLSLMFLLTSLFINAQTTITVDNSTGADADYDVLQDALDAATSGDIIYVHASETSYDDITIEKPITLIGFSHSSDDKESMIDAITLNSNASNVKISGFHITNDVNMSNSGTTLTNLIFENNFFDSVSDMFFNNGGATNVVIRGNVLNRIGSNSTSSLANNYTNTIISNNIVNEDINVKFHESVTIENNIFLDNAINIRNHSDATGDLEVEDCIFYVSVNSTYNPNDDGVVFNNCLSFNDIGSVADLIGSNNDNNTDPLFVSAGNDIFEAAIDDYNLQAGSNALGTGVDGDNMGIYNNSSFVFNNFGFTAGVPVVTITGITTQVAPGGTVEVTIQSNSN